MNNNNNTFEEYINKILLKDPSKILLELFPRLSHPVQSRFHEFFKKLKNNKEFHKKNNNNKNVLELNLYKIQNGIDKRTSLMIKNIPKGIDEINVVKWLIQLVKLNYVFVPKDEFSNKILGFAFINVCDYTDILKLLQKLSILETFNNNNKKIEVIYSHKQGLKSLTKSFGVSHIF
jgi:RNA recognition motif-containing protein